MNRNETISLLTALKMLDRQDRVTLDDVTIDLWSSLLHDIPAAAGMDAVKRWMLTSKWFPAPVEIRDLVFAHVCGLPTVETARRQIEQAMRQNYPGMPAKYTPDRIVLEAAREVGGVYVFRVAQSERETADLWRRFVTTYESMRRERAQMIDVAAEYAALSDGEPSNLRVLTNRSAS